MPGTLKPDVDAAVAEREAGLKRQLTSRQISMIALGGATQSLKTASAVQLEVSFFRFKDEWALAGEVIAFMQEHGYRVHDIFGLWGRPLDGALAQGDVLFLRDGHPLLGDHRWSTDAAWA